MHNFALVELLVLFFFVLVVSVVSSRELSWICCFQLGLGRDAYFLSHILMEILFIFSVTSPWLLAQSSAVWIFISQTSITVTAGNSAGEIVWVKF